MIAIGSTLSAKYRILRLLGDGGMGAVYEAEHLRLGTRVAIKILHGELVQHAGIVERFLQEASVSAQIQSPHVVRVVDVEQTAYGGASVAYLVMELLEGEPLGKTLDREPRLAVEVALEYTRQVLLGLEAAHALGVVHRDLKPDNVFVSFQAGKPTLKLIDFGIAKVSRTRMRAADAPELTVAGMLMGTAEYMAPEQVHEAAKVDARADLYAVGVILYEMLAGTRPVAGDAFTIVRKVERGDVRPLRDAAPQVPPELAGFVHRAMAPKPEHRFVSAAEMRLALEALAARLAPVRAGDERAAPAAAVVAAAVPAAAFVPAAALPAGDAQAQEGTLVGAPVAAVFATREAQRPEFSPEVNPKATTQRAAPVPMHGAPMQGAPLHPAPYAQGPATPAYVGESLSEAQMPRRRKKRATWPYVVFPLLGGAAIVGIIFAIVQGSSDPEPQATPGLATPVATPVAATSTARPGDPASTGELGSLRGDGPRPVANGPVVAPSARPSATAVDAGAGAPPMFPSAMPPFPSAMTFPSALPPFTVPSNFPTIPGLPGFQNNSGSPTGY